MNRVDRRPGWRRSTVITAVVIGFCSVANAQSPATEAPTAPSMSLDALAWLEGCWRGSVNQREFREHWLPLRGGMMVGISQTVMQDKTQDYEYLRIESRPDGVHYVAIPTGKKETAFRLTNVVADDRSTEFVFTNPVDEFPQRIVYRRGAEGWLYASIEGKLNGEDRKVVYPMRRIGCESGEVIRK
jgi:hypothetical protein